MFQLPADVPVYLHRAPVDFWLGINGLAATVEHAMQRDPWRARSMRSATVAATASNFFFMTALASGY
jgi:hypothetical protein